MKQKIEIELDVPDGYELTGEYRPTKRGEFFLAKYVGSLLGTAIDSWSGNPVLILRKKHKQYRVFEVTGEFRFPKMGEPFEGGDNGVLIGSSYMHHEQSILREVTDQVRVEEIKGSE